MYSEATQSIIDSRTFAAGILQGFKADIVNPHFTDAAVARDLKLEDQSGCLGLRVNNVFILGPIADCIQSLFKATFMELAQANGVSLFCPRCKRHSPSVPAAIRYENRSFIFVL